MKIAVVGPVDGSIHDLYAAISGENVSWILCTGELGVWPDSNRIDKATKAKGHQQDFANLYVNHWEAPVPLLFVAGVHEDHKWLEDRKKWENGPQLMEGVHWLMNGYKTIIGDAEIQVRVTGLGKVYSEATFNGRWNKRSKRHYTRRELEKGCSSGPTDILLLHEAPAEPVKNLIYATRPKLVFHSSLYNSREEIQGIPIIGIPRKSLEIYEI